MTKARFPSIVTSSKGFLQEKNDLSTMCTSDGFGQDTYKLIKESGYDFSTPSPEHVIDAKPCGAKDMQKMVQKQGDGIVTPRVSLDCMPS